MGIPSRVLSYVLCYVQYKLQHILQHLLQHMLQHTRNTRCPLPIPLLSTFARSFVCLFVCLFVCFFLSSGNRDEFHESRLSLSRPSLVLSCHHTTHISWVTTTHHRAQPCITWAHLHTHTHTHTHTPTCFQVPKEPPPHSNPRTHTRW